MKFVIPTKQSAGFAFISDICHCSLCSDAPPRIALAILAKQSAGLAFLLKYYADFDFFEYKADEEMDIEKNSEMCVYIAKILEKICGKI